MRSTKLVVDVRKITSNIIELRKNLAPDTKVMAIVKANAYGHGALGVALNVIENGEADWLGVATPEEGRYLFDKGVYAPVLVLGPANDDEYEMCVRDGYDDLRQTVFEKRQVLELNNIANKYGKKVYVHIKINSGMNRIGISDKEGFIELLDTFRTCTNVIPEGIFTHFATADEPDMTGSEKQMKKFEEMVDIAQKRGFSFKYIHACNTAATMRGFCNKFNMVRLGIGIYGYHPFDDEELRKGWKLEPAAEFITRISAINEIDAGDAVSYGATFVAEKKMRIATLPVGYADGYNRLLSNKGKVIINGKYASIIGKICMDQMMVDITDIPDAVEGSEAVLIGKRGDASITAEDLARDCQTISYEILTSVAQRVERVYIY